MSTLSVEDRALRMLAAGDSPIDISTATGLSRDEIAKLQRDFPGTRTQQPRPPAVPQRIGTATPAAGSPNPNLSRAIEGAGVTAPISLVSGTPDPAPDTAAEPASPLAILQDARSHSVARVRNPKQAAAAAENLKRARQPVQCPDCGRTFGHAGAMGNHRKTCTQTSQAS